MILSHTRDEVKKAVAQGALNIRALDHFDICHQRKAGVKRADVAKAFHISERQVTNITNCKCPEVK